MTDSSTPKTDRTARRRRRRDTAAQPPAAGPRKQLFTKGQQVPNLLFDEYPHNGRKVIAAMLGNGRLAIPGTFGEHAFKPKRGSVINGSVTERDGQYQVLPHDPEPLVATGEWVRIPRPLTAAIIADVVLRRSDDGRGPRLVGTYKGQKVLLERAQEHLGVDGLSHQLQLTSRPAMRNVLIGLITPSFLQELRRKKAQAVESEEAKRFRRPQPPVQPEDLNKVTLRRLMRGEGVSAVVDYGSARVIDEIVDCLTLLNKPAAHIRTGYEDEAYVVRGNAQKLVGLLKREAHDRSSFLIREGVYWRIQAIEEACRRVLNEVPSPPKQERRPPPVVTKEIVPDESVTTQESDEPEASAEPSAASTEPSTAPKKKRRRRSKGKRTLQDTAQKPREAAPVNANGAATEQDIAKVAPAEKKFGATLGDLMKMKLGLTA